MQRHVVITGLAAAAQLMNVRLAVAASSSAALSFVVHQPKTPTHYHNYRHSRYSVAIASRRLHSTRPDASVCDVDLDSTIQLPDLVTKKGSAAILRKATLQNVDGDKVLLGERMGTDDDTSIIVFLRHLA